MATKGRVARIALATLALLVLSGGCNANVMNPLTTAGAVAPQTGVRLTVDVIGVDAVGFDPDGFIAGVVATKFESSSAQQALTSLGGNAAVVSVYDLTDFVSGATGVRVVSTYDLGAGIPFMQQDGQYSYAEFVNSIQQGSRTGALVKNIRKFTMLGATVPTHAGFRLSEPWSALGLAPLDPGGTSSVSSNEYPVDEMGMAVMGTLMAFVTTLPSPIETAGCVTCILVPQRIYSLYGVYMQNMVNASLNPQMPGMLPGTLPGTSPGIYPGMLPGVLPGTLPGMIPDTGFPPVDTSHCLDDMVANAFLPPGDPCFGHGSVNFNNYQLYMPPEFQNAMHKHKSSTSPTVIAVVVVIAVGMIVFALLGLMYVGRMSRQAPRAQPPLKPGFNAYGNNPTFNHHPQAPVQGTAPVANGVSYPVYPGAAPPPPPSQTQRDPVASTDWRDAVTTRDVAAAMLDVESF